MSSTDIKYYDIYAQELARRGDGHPLWCPEPDQEMGQVEIGDVGYLDHGHFYFLFSAVNPERNKKRGNPDQYEPFVIPSTFSQHYMPSVITESALASKTIQYLNATGEASLGGSAVNIGSSWEFKSSKSSGAFLILRTHAHRTHLDCRLRIEQFIKRNISNWLKFANDTLGLGKKEEDIIFVNGFTKTALWAAATFHHEKTDSSMQLSGSCNLNVLPASGNAKFEVKVGETHEFNIETRIGPPELATKWNELSKSPGDLEPNQCIFIEYYRLKRSWKFLTKIVAAAGPHELPPPGPPSTSSTVPSSDMQVVSEQECFDEDFGFGGAQRRFADPEECLSDYLLKQSGADVVCASHSDLTRLFRGQPLPDDIAGALRALSPPVTLERRGDGTTMAYLNFEDFERSAAKAIDQQVRIRRICDGAQQRMGRKGSQRSVPTDIHVLSGLVKPKMATRRARAGKARGLRAGGSAKAGYLRDYRNPWSAVQTCGLVM